MPLMASTDDVTRLAALARIKVADDALPQLAAEFESILAYIGQIAELDTASVQKQEKPAVRNVFREDGEPHASGLHTQKLAEQFPHRDGDALKVKQIISHD